MFRTFLLLVAFVVWQPFSVGSAVEMHVDSSLAVSDVLAAPVVLPATAAAAAVAEPDPVPAVTTVSPRRALDTRGGLKPAPRDVIFVPLAGSFGVPADAHSVLLSVIAVEAEALGFVTLWPCASVSDPVPNASVLNYAAGWNRVNGVVSGLGPSGGVCIFSQESTHIVVDVQGFSSAPELVTITPSRLVDTRDPSDSPFAAQEIRRYDVSALVGSAPSVFLNVTSTGITSDGFISVYPCASTATPPPDTSTVNYIPSADTANNALTGLVDGGFCVLSYTEGASAHIVIDVMGFLLPAAAGIETITPFRLLDTRLEGRDFGISSSHGWRSTSGPFAAGEVRMISVAGSSNDPRQPALPSNAIGIVANFTSVSPTGSAHMTAWPCSSPYDQVPDTSMLNFSAGWNATPNNVAMMLDGGNLCVYTFAGSHLLIDVSAVLTSPAPFSLPADFSALSLSGSFDVRFNTCLPAEIDPDSVHPTGQHFVWDPVTNSSAADIVALIESDRDAFLGPLVRMGLGTLSYNLVAGQDFASCTDVGEWRSAEENVINVMQYSAGRDDVWWAGLANSSSIYMNLPLAYHPDASVDPAQAARSWAGVFAHEVGHSVWNLRHTGFTPIEPYGSAFDLMSSSSSDRLYATSLLNLAAITADNFAFRNSSGSTSVTLVQNPSETGLVPGASDKIAYIVPLESSSDFPHPTIGASYYDGTALVIEGTARSDRTIYSRCPDYGIWRDCDALVFSLVSYTFDPSTNEVVTMSNPIAASTSGQEILLAGESITINGLTVSLDAFDASSKTFDVTVSGAFNGAWSADGFYIPAPAAALFAPESRSRAAFTSELPDVLRGFGPWTRPEDGDGDHDHDGSCGCLDCC